ncbi:MAG: hypothetical protein LBC67_03940 [Spirochaetales bacterium]|jgi:hypothetical protein|nr:hypothetical protein [Spirochaetales bacterium]
MKKTSYERWKSAFLTLPDEAFFDILRNYLGDFKTPFNKHTLFASLEQFLRKTETQERIVSLISRDDAQLLTALSVLDSPGPDDIYHLFEGEISYLDLHLRLLNLQDRLLIYTDKSSGTDEIFLNPFLEEALKSQALDAGLLLSCIPVQGCLPPISPESAVPRAPWPGDALLAAFLSSLSEDGDILKADRSLKKKAASSLREKFPALFRGSISRRSREGEERDRPALLVRSLETLRLVRCTGGVLEPDFAAWEEFAAFTPEARLCLIAAAGNPQDGSSPRGFFSVWEEARWLSAFLDRLEPEKAYTEKSLIRLGRLLSSPQDGLCLDSAWFENLLDFEVFLPYGEDSFVRAELAPAQDKAQKAVIQPNFEVSFPPGLPLAQCIVPAAALRLLRCDVHSQYELCKASFSRALALGFDGKTLAAALKNIAGGELPQNIGFSLDVWEKEYRSISFFEGVLVLAEEERRHLLDHSREFQKLVRLHPAPGAYLVGRASIPACLAVLREAGIDIPPGLRQAEELPLLAKIPKARENELFAQNPAAPPCGILFPGGFSPPKLKIPHLANAGRGNRKDAESRAKKLKTELLAGLAEADLPEDQSGEIRERIKNGLILFPGQIRHDLGRREKTEARGVNYPAKILIIEQAFSSKTSYLELIVRTQGGEPSRFLLRPQNLRRQGGDLVLEGSLIPGGERREIPVKKISLVRRLRGSLMG